jgi:hypothetical protein
LELKPCKFVYQRLNIQTFFFPEFSIQSIHFLVYLKFNSFNAFAARLFLGLVGTHLGLTVTWDVTATVLLTRRHLELYNTAILSNSVRAGITNKLVINCFLVRPIFYFSQTRYMIVFVYYLLRRPAATVERNYFVGCCVVLVRQITFKLIDVSFSYIVTFVWRGFSRVS